MRTVLGIDAAWTAHQPSGVALVGAAGGGWRLLAVEPSYAALLARAGGRGRAERASDSGPDPTALLEACAAIGGDQPDLVAVDMPLSNEAIAGRRPCDNAVSAAYGARKAGTHTPTRERPGAISDALRAEFAACGYQLLTSQVACPGLAEVYPHPALIELTGAAERLPYKAAKTGTYWRSMGPMQRHAALRRVWADILGALEIRSPASGPCCPYPKRRCAVER